MGAEQVIHLEERKRDCLKAEKKMMLTGKRRGNSVAGLLKRPSWGKGGVKGENADVEGKGYAGAICDEGDEDGSGDSEDDDEGKEAAVRRRSVSDFKFFFSPFLPA